MTLTSQQMLDLWRLVRGFEPLRADGIVTRTDGVDIDRILTLDMQAWYDNLLLTAPTEQLCPVDISSSIVYTVNSDNSVTIPLPQNVVRITDVRLDCWNNSARILIPGRDDAEIARQASPFACAGTSNPIAIHATGALRLYSLPHHGYTPVITTLNAILRPTDNTFSFHPTVLHALLDRTIP